MPASNEFKIVGKPIPRLDGPPKVCGTAVFLEDREIPGTWVGGTMRSPIAYGKLKGIRKNPDFDLRNFEISC